MKKKRTNIIKSDFITIFPLWIYGGTIEKPNPIRKDMLQRYKTLKTVINKSYIVSISEPYSKDFNVKGQAYIETMYIFDIIMTNNSIYSCLESEYKKFIESL